MKLITNIENEIFNIEIHDDVDIIYTIQIKRIINNDEHRSFAILKSEIETCVINDDIKGDTSGFKFITDELKNYRHLYLKALNKAQKLGILL